MPCACQKIRQGSERGTVEAWVVHVEETCALKFGDRCVVFASESDAAAAAVENGFTVWTVVPVMV